MKKIKVTVTWAKWVLLLLGGIFLLISIVLALIPLPSTATVNGVKQSMTPSLRRLFHVVLSGGFAMPAVILLLISGIMTVRDSVRRKRQRELTDAGNFVLADQINLVPTLIRFNYEPIMRLTCTYTDKTGQKILFTGPMVRYDPTALLKNGKVKVYVDTNDIHNYFVDLEGSMEGVIQA